MPTLSKLVSPVEKQPTGPVRYDGDCRELDPEVENWHFFERLNAQGEPTENYVPIGVCPHGEVGDIAHFEGGARTIQSVSIEFLDDLWQWVVKGE